jgi:DNA polymerase IV
VHRAERALVGRPARGVPPRAGEQAARAVEAPVTAVYRVLHVDLDQFIAAVEVLRHPELAGRPVVVGGHGDPTRRGVVATANYEARAFGIRSGMPLRTAAKRCPDAVFLPADNAAYEAASEPVMAVLREFSATDGAVVEVFGWDEAFVGATTDDPDDLARRIRAAVHERTRLTCCVGIGDTLLRAKTATGFAKPPVRDEDGVPMGAGVFTLTAANWYAVMGDRPTQALWGIGAKTAAKLADRGLHTVRELAAADPAALGADLGPTLGPWYVQVGQGLSRVEVRSEPWVARSRGHEETFPADLTEWADVRAAATELARRVAADVETGGRPAARVTVTVRFAPFTTRSHGTTLAAPTADRAVIEAAALAALDRFTRRRPVRLVGVRAEFAPASDTATDTPP